MFMVSQMVLCQREGKQCVYGRDIQRKNARLVGPVPKGFRAECGDGAERERINAGAIGKDAESGSGICGVCGGGTKEPVVCDALQTGEGAGDNAGEAV